MGAAARLAWFALAYAVLLELLLVGAILFFPDFEENVDVLRRIAPMKALKDMVGELQEGGVVAYVVGQQFFKGCNTLGTAAAVLFAAPAVAGEAHRGTLELWLSRPVSRARLLSERLLGGSLAVVVPVFATSATIPWLCERIGEEVALAPMLLCSVHQSALLLAIFGVTFLASATGRTPVRIAVAMLFVTTFEFAIYMIERVTHWSVYRLTDVDDFLTIADTGTLDWRRTGSLLAVWALCWAGAVVAVGRRVP